MDFFRPPPQPERPPSLPPLPEWVVPPDDELGELVPAPRLLARTDEIAIAVAGFRAYSSGFRIELGIRTRRRSLLDPFGMQSRMLQQATGEPLPDELPDDLFRFGVEFADGRRATSLEAFTWRPPDSPPPPVFISFGGGGGGAVWDWNVWIWPLPPPGGLALVCELPAFGVDLTRTEVEARPILEAARRSLRVWV